MRRALRNPELAKRWLTFLRNHREAIAAMDFFTVPTLTFNVLYCFFVISHDRRRILQFNVTQHPTSAWIANQIRDAFPYESVPNFLLFDHDPKYGFEVPATIRAMKITPLQTSVGCPWQNGVAERWVGSCRRDLLDHVIALNERHLKRLLSEYISYYHEDRTHLGLGKGTPAGRTPVLPRGSVIALPRVGGVHLSVLAFSKPSRGIGRIGIQAGAIGHLQPPHECVPLLLAREHTHRSLPAYPNSGSISSSSPCFSSSGIPLASQIPLNGCLFLPPLGHGSVGP